MLRCERYAALRGTRRSPCRFETQCAMVPRSGSTQCRRVCGDRAHLRV